jgi:hypothetical protein
MSVKRAKLVILAVSILARAASYGAGQIASKENTATVSDREQHGLRGSVKSCTEESTYPGTDADGKTYAEVHSEYTTEYRADGRILVTRLEELRSVSINRLLTPKELLLGRV